MLILTRRVGESLMIGDQVTVTVLGVKGNQVRLGVNAPKDVSVHREEIYERIKRVRGLDEHAPAVQPPVGGSICTNPITGAVGNLPHPVHTLPGER